MGTINKIGKQLTKQEIKKKGLEVLKYVAKFCEENNINYFLAYGTLIGAVRHKGFIPWDEDIDIFMLRSEYNKFIDLWIKLNIENQSYALLGDMSIDKNGFSFSKIVDLSTTVFEHGIQSPKGGVWVDVFPVDGLPDSKTLRHKHFNKVYKLFSILNVRRYFDRKFHGISKILRIVKYSIKHFQPFFLLPSLFWFNRLLKQVKKYPEENATYVVSQVCCYWNNDRRAEGYPRSCLTGYIYAPFEDGTFRIPKDYDAVLKCYYGDYMTLPPEDKRIDTHGIEAYWIRDDNEN